MNDYPQAVLNLLELLHLVGERVSRSTAYFDPMKAQTEKAEASDALRQFLAARYKPREYKLKQGESLMEFEIRAFADPVVRILECQQRGQPPTEPLLEALGFGDALAVALADDLVSRAGSGIVLEKEGRAVLARRRLQPTEEGKPRGQPTKRAGRPNKGDTDKQLLVLGHLLAHHQYEDGGSIGNYEPAKPEKLAEGTSTATVSRFFKSKLDRGYKGYANACARKQIGRLLAEWQGDLTERRPEGRREEEEPGSRKSGRRKPNRTWNDDGED